MPREDGFYWIRYSGAAEPSVARYFSDGEDCRMWYLTAYDGWLEEAEVTVLSERLLPPEVKSNG